MEIDGWLKRRNDRQLAAPRVSFIREPEQTTGHDIGFLRADVAAALGAFQYPGRSRALELLEKVGSNWLTLETASECDDGGAPPQREK